jgi:GT2 family glycosyltransferase
MKPIDNLPRVDIIILSLVKDTASLNRTQKCIESYLKSDLVTKVYVVESNREFAGSYADERVELIIPNEDFNYNKFYNIALQKCTSEFVMGPNNDLVVHPNCIEQLVNQFDNNSDLGSLCPVDRKWHRHTKMYLPTDNKIYYGYETSLHMFGCVFMCRRSIFSKIGYLDERFFFFYQDNDYIMSLNRLGILHGVYTGAEISHESGGSNNISKGRCEYTDYNMSAQGTIFMNKWFNEEPFISGGYVPFKQYENL